MYINLQFLIYQKTKFVYLWQPYFVILAFKLLKQVSNAKFGLCFEERKSR